MTTTAHAVHDAARPQGGRWAGRLLTAVLVLPAGLWYLVLLVAPLALILVFSVGERGATGGYGGGFTLENYASAFRNPTPFVTSLQLSIMGTLLCLLIGLPLAYLIATRGGSRKALLVVLLVIPFWVSFLIRTYAWLTILGPDGIAGWIGDVTGNRGFRILGTDFAVLLGLVYGYLPLMVFPLYVTLERMDRSLVEASKDLGAGRWATFRQVTLPMTLPGLITGSILVFIPMMGEYVIPQILGYGQVFTVGNALVLRFLESRNWPAGSAQAVGLMLVMLITVTFYLWFTNRGRQVREQSVL
ncbi:MAG TPA: ABC transporter permease [Candidatus Limnocylindrales bacterium]|jgi:spermidine/putrescine transport system permease protein